MDEHHDDLSWIDHLRDRTTGTGGQQRVFVRIESALTLRVSGRFSLKALDCSFAPI